MRKRNNDVHIMLNDDEHLSLLEIQRKTGLRLRELILNAVSDKPFITDDCVAEIRRTNELLARLNVALNRIGNNINQLAKSANAQGELPTEQQLADIKEQLAKYKEGSEKLWRYIRQLTARL